SSVRVFSPESAAIATRALNSALCCFRFTPTSHAPFGPVSPLAYPAVQNSGAAALGSRYLLAQTMIVGGVSSMMTGAAIEPAPAEWLTDCGLAACPGHPHDGLPVPYRHPLWS